MGVRIEYTVEKLPESYVTTKKVYKYIPDPDWKQEDHGNGAVRPRIRVEEEVEEHGGWLFTFMRGHQIRVTSMEQMKLFGIHERPRLIDESTGFECNEHGVPLDIAHVVKHGTGLAADGTGGDTGASLLAAQARSNTGDPIEDAINDTE